MNTKKILLLNNIPAIAEALERYLRFVLGINNAESSILSDPYRRKEIFEKAKWCDLMVIDGFTEQKPNGFQFSKIMAKRALLLFYPNEIDIEKEGPSWIVLPYALERLGNKIEELLMQPATNEEEYEKLEKRFLELGEKGEHHR